MTIFQQLDPALPMKFHQMIIIMISVISIIQKFNVNNNKFSFSSTSSSIVFSHLNKLCGSKATGLDNISAKIIRECADLISVSLCDLFNKSLFSGIFLTIGNMLGLLRC